MDSGKVVLGVLAGVAAGAILGILFAPEKGSVTLSLCQGFVFSLHSSRRQHSGGMTSKAREGREGQRVFGIQQKVFDTNGTPSELCEARGKA